MRLENQKQEQPNEPLSTSALAHVDEQREPENRANERARDPLGRRETESAVGDAERPAGRRTDTGATGRSPDERTRGDRNRMDGAANRQPVAIGKTPDQDQNPPLFSEQESRDLFAKWDALQVGFIDEPRAGCAAGRSPGGCGDETDGRGVRRRESAPGTPVGSRRQCFH